LGVWGGGKMIVESETDFVQRQTGSIVSLGAWGEIRANILEVSFSLHGLRDESRGILKTRRHMTSTGKGLVKGDNRQIEQGEGCW